MYHPRRAPSKNPAENPPASGTESFKTDCDFFQITSTSSASTYNNKTINQYYTSNKEWRNKPSEVFVVD